MGDFSQNIKVVCWNIIEVVKNLGRFWCKSHIFCRNNKDFGQSLKMLLKISNMLIKKYMIFLGSKYHCSFRNFKDFGQNMGILGLKHFDRNLVHFGPSLKILIKILKDMVHIKKNWLNSQKFTSKSIRFCSTSQRIWSNSQSFRYKPQKCILNLTYLVKISKIMVYILKSFF